MGHEHLDRRQHGRSPRRLTALRPTHWEHDKHPAVGPALRGHPKLSPVSNSRFVLRVGPHRDLCDRSLHLVEKTQREKARSIAQSLGRSGGTESGLTVEGPIVTDRTTGTPITMVTGNIRFIVLGYILRSFESRRKHLNGAERAILR